MKGLNKFSNYYEKNGGNFEGGLYWEKRVGDDHIVMNIKPHLGASDKRNRAGYLNITNNSSYEYYLQLSNEAWKRTAEIYSIKINEITVEDLKNFKISTSEEKFYGDHFVVKGHLENIKEMKNVPNSLRNIVSSLFLKFNRDKYLAATLTDDTGSVDVFLQTTSLNKEELSKKRNHNVVLFDYENSPVRIVRFSTLIE